jgi:hypothetical protein
MADPYSGFWRRAAKSAVFIAELPESQTRSWYVREDRKSQPLRSVPGNFSRFWRESSWEPG